MPVRHSNKRKERNTNTMERQESNSKPEIVAQQKAGGGCQQEPCSLSSGVEAAVCEDIAKRQRLGIQKYGVTVADNFGLLFSFFTLGAALASFAAINGMLNDTMGVITICAIINLSLVSMLESVKLFRQNASLSHGDGRG